MEDKKRALLYLCIVLIFAIISLVIFLNIIEPRFYMVTTGNVISGGSSQKNIYIHSPENKTYFSKDRNNYFIYLNVSANFEVTEWRYDIIDTENKEVVSEDIAFNPGDKVGFLRTSNRITVRASDESGNILEKSAEFTFSSKDSFPIIKDIESVIYVCEGERLEYNLSVLDPNGNANPGPIEVRIDSPDNFYITPDKKQMLGLEDTANFQIISSKLTKEDAGGIDKGSKVYNSKVSVSDGKYYSSNKTDIVVVEKNNPPKIEIIGAKTEIINLKKDNEVSYKLNVSDVEDGNQNSGNLRFNISFVDISSFEINSNGVISFKFDEGDIGIHNVEVCVGDTGIELPHKKIKEVCNQDGNDQTSCTNFSITITESNNPPTITEYYPKEPELKNDKKIKFNLTVFDPEETVPDVYWYVDGELVKYDSGVDLKRSSSSLEYDFSCGSSQHIVRARATDGLMNDSIEWKIINDGCVSGCGEKWVCEQWKVCQNLDTSFDSGILSEEDYRSIKDKCIANRWEDENCGFQIRDCFDISECNSQVSAPEIIRRCFYTENPDCEDGIINCHSRDCEILTDCGGPCKECPTCYDGVQNQGEEGIDCEGPCYAGCEIKERPTYIKNPLKYFLIILIFVLLIIIALKIMNISRIRKEIKREDYSYHW